MLPNVLQFLKTSFDATSPACDEDLRRLLLDVLDESMRTGFAQALDPTVPRPRFRTTPPYVLLWPTHRTWQPQHDKTRFEASLRSRIVEVLVKDSSTLRRHIETTFISPAYPFSPFCVHVATRDAERPVWWWCG